MVSTPGITEMPHKIISKRLKGGYEVRDSSLSLIMRTKKDMCVNERKNNAERANRSEQLKCTNALYSIVCNSFLLFFDLSNFLLFCGLDW